MATPKNATTTTTPATPVATAPVAPATQPTTTATAVATPTAPTAVSLANMAIGAALGFAPNQTFVGQKTPAAKLGVQPNARTRAYFAGVVVATNGHATGVNPAMVAAVNQLFGSANNIESEICLRNAWHAIRGYMATAGLTMPGPVAVGANGNGMGS